MTYIPPENYIQTFERQSNSKYDAFGRLRVSNPHTLFESQMQYDEQPLLWENIIIGNASSNHLPYQSSLDLNVTSSGDKFIRETYENFRYQPGKSQLIFMTGVMGANSGGRKRVGYYNDVSGIFYEQDPVEGLRFGIRSNAADGLIPQDTYANQATWNLDKFPELDPTQAFIIVMDMEWLGMGTVRVGFVHDGKIRYVHAFHHANNLNMVYMPTANLPCRYEVEYVSGADSLKQTCTTVISEGGYVNKGIVRYQDLGATSVLVDTTQSPILSIRLKNTFCGAQIIPEKCSIMQNSNSNTLRYMVVARHPLSGATWNDISADSPVEYSTNGTYSGGGIIIDGGFLPPKSPSPIDLDFSNMPPLTCSSNSETMILSIIVQGIGGTVPTYAGIRFRELK